MDKLIRKAVLVFIDIALIMVSVYLSYLLRFDFKIPESFSSTFPYVFLLYTSAIICSFYAMKIYRRIWRYASVGDLISIFKGALLGSVCVYITNEMINYFQLASIVVPRSIHIMATILIFVFVGGSRILMRILRDNYRKLQPHHKRALIIGAGEAGLVVVRELKHTKSDFYPIAFIDDDIRKNKMELMGVPVVGTREDIPAAVKKYDIDIIIIAMPSASKETVAEIINIAKKTNCKIKIIPRVNDLINGKISVTAIRDVSVEDLLGRDPVSVDIRQISKYLTDRTVLVTGAGGSIGSEICRQVASVGPKMLLLMDHNENNLYEIELELRHSLPDIAIQPLIADIKDKKRLNSIFREHRPDVVFHAAAHKHVPLMEYNPGEAIKNNVFGTLNIAQCAHEYGAKRFVLISTDKAVNPTSIMGATKRIAEMIMQSINEISQTEYAAVRFGNVLGSKGSVIPLFKKQIEAGGPVTVTHPEMVRYFMTIPEAVQLVIQAGALAKGGEVFILDMGKPVKIVDLATDLIRLSGYEPGKDIKVIFTGPRPGEKLFEEILTKEEGSLATKHDRIFISRPEVIPNEELNRMLVNLEKAETEEEMKKAIQQLVPTYCNRDKLNRQNDYSEKEALQASLEVVAALDNGV